MHQQNRNTTSNPQSYKLLIVDDHEIVIDGIRSVLDDVPEIEIIGSAMNGQEALDLTGKLQPDVILMDINMPEMNGIEACKKIKKYYPEKKVLALTQFNEKRLIKLILKNGASGYVLKDACREEILEAIQTVCEGGQSIPAGSPPDIFEKQKKESQYNPLFPDLSDREKEVLHLISEEYNTQEIAERLSLSIHTVETHRAHLLQKSGTRNTAGLVRWAVEYGML